MPSYTPVRQLVQTGMPARASRRELAEAELDNAYLQQNWHSSYPRTLAFLIAHIVLVGLDAVSEVDKWRAKRVCAT